MSASASAAAGTPPPPPPPTDDWHTCEMPPDVKALLKDNADARLAIDKSAAAGSEAIALLRATRSAADELLQGQPDMRTHTAVIMFSQLDAARESAQRCGHMAIHARTLALRTQHLATHPYATANAQDQRGTTLAAESLLHAAEQAIDSARVSNRAVSRLLTGTAVALARRTLSPDFVDATWPHLSPATKAARASRKKK